MSVYMLDNMIFETLVCVQFGARAYALPTLWTPSGMPICCVSCFCTALLRVPSSTNDPRASIF